MRPIDFRAMNQCSIHSCLRTVTVTSQINGRAAIPIAILVNPHIISAIAELIAHEALIVAEPRARAGRNVNILPGAAETQIQIHMFENITEP